MQLQEEHPSDDDDDETSGLTSSVFEHFSPPALMNGENHECLFFYNICCQFSHAKIELGNCLTHHNQIYIKQNIESTCFIAHAFIHRM